MFILILYAILLIVYSAFLIQQAHAFKTKFGYLCECSGLGERKNRLFYFYNLGYFLFGLLSIAFTFYLSEILPKSIWTTSGIIFLYIADVSLCIIALFPRDTFLKIHTASSTTLFIGTIMSLLLLIPPFVTSPKIPNIIILLNLFIVVTLGYYSYLKVLYFTKSGIINVREPEVSIYEWVPFLSTFLWSLILTVILVVNG